VVSYTLRQVTAIVDGPAYKVTNQVLAATDADVYVFVYNAASQKFSHYALAADVEQWPTSPQIAQVTGAQFYRQNSVERVWASVQEMNADLDDTIRRVQALADELNAQRESLIIDRTTVIQGA
jgi:hypothetical protein